MTQKPTYAFDTEGHTVVTQEKKDEPGTNTSPRTNYFLLFVKAAFLVLGICLSIAFAIHVQIPDQQYCDTILEQRHYDIMGPVWYIESQHRYEYSLNQSQCIYDSNGTFIANPEFSIWGIRV